MRNVLVTGGSGGIGSAIAVKFAECGDRVAITYNKNKEEAMRLSLEYNIIAIPADLSSVAGASLAADKITDMLGAVDVIVNCAGYSVIRPLSMLSEDEISELVSINLTSHIILTKKLSASMIASGYGRIINIGSMWGARGASCEVVYSAAKAGLEGFTKALAKELGPSGITVNCVEPGFTETKMNKNIDAESVKEIIDSTPLGRAGTPFDVAETVYFLASDKASFITAQCIGVDGAIIL